MLNQPRNRFLMPSKQSFSVKTYLLGKLNLLFLIETILIACD